MRRLRRVSLSMLSNPALEPTGGVTGRDFATDCGSRRRLNAQLLDR